MKLLTKETPLKGLFSIKSTRLGDNRGSFSRHFCQQQLQELMGEENLNQINLSFTKTKGSIRGMHYQLMPFSEIKIVKCIQGEILDVAVDLRTGSDTYMHWHSQVLSKENDTSLFIPTGFAHGFQTLTEDCELLYLHSQPYSPEYERTLNYADPKLAIDWSLPVSQISDKDKLAPMLTADFTGITDEM